jgi:hypothetical protein
MIDIDLSHLNGENVSGENRRHSNAAPRSLQQPRRG